MRKPRYLYWIEDEKGSGIGHWETRAGAQKAVKYWSSQLGRTYSIKRHNAVPCPLCGELTEEDTRESFGMCLRCDHVQGDVVAESMEEAQG